ncbi:Ig-like domain-containing protein [Pseudomonas sp. MWU13-2100]|uniref:Ig-like domain-containing protein n=1 Tax=Pseudomonas sp. MWU13-2100 TaxID=2935075 RepID=UPI00200EEE06|nr:Ig-like domain-containing protein [Pseudomonas sp. MWU13-2100]
MIIPLEPRMLFDGAVAATVAEAAQPASHATTDAAKAPATDHATAPAAAHPQSDATPTPAPAAVPGQSVVFVDSRVQDFSALLKGAAPGTQVVVLQAGKDGLQQIADYLDGHKDVSTVEIIAHGNSGDLWLGSTYLSSDNVAARADVLARIGNDMNVGGDILIYACNTAAGDKGIGFVDSLAQYTGRDIAASTNRTGLGGDWTLEISTGVIESHNVLSADAMAAYQYGLSTITVTSNADSGVGSLRSALSSAVAGDIVTFNASMTVNLNSQLVISKNLTVEGDLNHDGVADVTLSGQYKTQVLVVNSGITATLDGLVITQGLAAGNGAAAGVDGTAAMGGGIVNAGNLTLNNVTVTSNAASGGGGGGGVTAPYVGGAVGGGGGGGGALGGQNGGHGGSSGFGSGVYGGTAGTANHGGTGGGYNPNYMGGKGGSSTGGAGGIGAANYSNGGAGGTANNGTISIGGGGGGSGWDKAGRAGASASGGIYNASTGTLTIVGTSVISNNIAAGGGGGGGGGLGGSADPGGAAGKGVGAIWNKGTVLMTAANFAAMTGNVGGSGSGGPALGGGSTGASVAAVNNIFNDGGTLNTAYAPAPTATIVVTNTAQHIGSTSLVTFTFNQAVTGFTNADLTIANGTLTAVSSSDGGTTWTATFTPSSSTTSATNQIVLDNTGVSSVSTSAVGSGTTSSNNYTIDTVRPTATVSVVASTLSTAANSTVNITFSEAVSGFSLADMSASNGTLSNLSTSDNIHWTATLTPVASNNSSGNVITLDNTLYTDTATNAGTGTTTSNTYAVDTVRPTASIVVSNNALNIGGTSLVTITFSEAVTGFTNADLTVADGTLSAVSSSDGGITWTATLTPTAGVTHTGDVITLTNTGVQDTAGNAGSGTTNSNAYAVDTQRPTATVVFANTNLGIGQTSLVTITFSEAVTGFTNADLTVSNGTLSAVSSSDGGVTWTATFTPTAAIVSASNHITLDNTGVQDTAGNAGSGSTTSNNVAIDGVRPTATVVVANSALKIGDTSLVTITFSEAVVGFTNADLTVSNGTLSAVSSSDGGITWTATFTPSASVTNTSNVISLDNTGYTDTSGNAGTGSTSSNNYAIDTQRPTATIVLADPTLTAGATSLVTITFSEAVTGFTLADLSVSHGSLSGLSSSDGGITWTATFTPGTNTNSATNAITLANTGIADLAGNAGAGTTNSANFTIDTVLPAATIVVANPALNIGGTSLVTITFNEAVSGFTNADLTVANGTLSAVSSSDGGVTWTATFTPATNTANATNHITLDNSGVQAAVSGNVGTGTSNSNNYAIDTQRPTATVVVTNDHLGIGGTSLVTITFSEAVTGFSLADLTTDNGILSGLSTSDNITYTATLTPVAGITQNNNHIVLDNSTVADVAGNSGTGTSSSNAYDIDSVRPTSTIVVASPTLAAGQTSLVTITFSEAVTGFDNSDLSVPNGTLSAVSSSDGGITWTATFTPTSNVQDTTNVISLNNAGYTDLANNAGTGVTNSGNFTIDTVRPTATIVMADNALKIGDTSLVTITFSEAVTGFSNADLTISHGTLTGVTSSDGGITWTATFTPTSNITDSSNVIELDNTGVANVSGNAGSGVTDSNNYSIDTQRPTASIVVANNALNIGGTSLVTITFSEAVSGFSNADLTVADGTLSAVSSSDGGITWTATLTPNAATTHTGDVITLNNAGVSDLAGNAGAGSTLSNIYGVDTVAPTATIVVASPTLAVGQTSLVTITFSEAVIGFDNSDLSVPNGTLSTVSSADGGITWTATFTPTSNVHDTTNIISLNNAGYTDLASNAGTGVTNSGNFTIDTVRPTATIVVADNALKIGETSLVTITFSEAVTGFSNADLTISHGTLTGVTSSDGGITWTATFTPTSNITDSSNLIELDNTGVANASGNAGSGVTDSNNYSIDTQRPTASIVVANNALNIGGTSLVTITFSEAVSGFSNADLTVADGTLSAVSSSDGGITWTATLTPNAATTHAGDVITLNNTGVSDLAGNAGAGSTLSNTYGVDTVAPTATVVIDHSALNIGQTAVVTVTFSEAVTGFSNADLSVANGTLSTMTSSDGGITWTGTFTPTSNIAHASNVISLNNTTYSDLAGNAGSGTTTSNTYAVDTQRPTATVVMADSALKIGQTSMVTITFSEAVSGFSNADLTVANGTLSAVSSSDGGITWTATFTPTSNITHSGNVISLNNAGYTDLAGNAGTGTSDSNTYAIDTQRPTATISVANNNLGIGQTTTVTIAFSEAVTGFNLSELSVPNGTLSNLASADGGKTWTATLTPTAAITDATNLIVLDTSLVSDTAGNAGASIAISNNYALDADRPTATISVANPNLTVGQTTVVTFTFSEKVSNFDLSELSVANGVLSNLATHDGGKTWTATLTPTANVTDPSNFITLDNSQVTDLAGNAGTGFANSNNFAVNTVALGGDPQFRVDTPVARPEVPNQPLQSQISITPTGSLGSPLGFPPLFEQRTSGDGLPPVGNIFINQNALAPSYIAQVFSTDSGAKGSTSGFLGFGGGDGGVFGGSTLSGIFSRESGNSDTSTSQVFDRNGKGLGDQTQGVRGIFGAPTLGQQLQKIKDGEQKQLHELAWALEQVGISEMSA